MDAEQIRRLEPQLADYLDRFEDCFARRDTRAHFPCMCEGNFGVAAEERERWRLAAGTSVRRCKSS